jgi:23S rRNA (uracil1939-C5)-methyltransferase
VTPRCRHAGPCGGCDWQHIAYASQLERKRQHLVDLLDEATRGASRGWHIAPTVPTRGTAADTAGADRDAPWGFRRKVHFAWVDTDEGVDLAHYARGGRRLIPIEECPVHDPAGNTIAWAIRDVMRRHGVRAADARSGRGTLRHVVVRASASDRQALVTLVVTDPREPRLRKAVAELGGARAGAVGLHVNVHPAPSPYLFGTETRRVSGSSQVREVVGGVSFLIPPTSFFQTNTEAAGVLVALVRDAAHGCGARTVLDLYAGVGLFALTLAADGFSVTAVEGQADAVRNGRTSAAYHGHATRCRWVQATAQQFLRTRADRGYDVVVLDPPRSGLAPRELEGWLARVGPARLVYVSCDPASLARDLASALRAIVAGRVAPYRVEAVVPVDMFPHTVHLESVALLTRAGIAATAWPSVPHDGSPVHDATGSPALGNAGTR